MDSPAGRLSRHGRWRLWIGIAAVGALLCAGGWFWQAGLIYPELRLASPTDITGVEIVDGEVRIQAMVTNDAQSSATVLDIGLSGPGIELIGVQGGAPGQPSPFPVTLGSGEAVDFALAYRITDCAAIDVFDPWPVTASVQRPWGKVTAPLVRTHVVMGPAEEAADFWCGR